MPMGNKNVGDFAGRDLDGVKLLKDGWPAVNQNRRFPSPDEVGAVCAAAVWNGGAGPEEDHLNHHGAFGLYHAALI